MNKEIKTLKPYELNYLSYKVMKKIGIIPSKNFTAETFLLKIPIYQIKDTKIYIAQIDKYGNDLRKKDIWQLYGGNNMKISNDFLIDCTGNELINEINNN